MDWGVEGRGEPNGRGHGTVRNPPSAKEVKISQSPLLHTVRMCHTAWCHKNFNEAVQTLYIYSAVDIYLCKHNDIYLQITQARLSG